MRRAAQYVVGARRVDDDHVVAVEKPLDDALQSVLAGDLGLPAMGRGGGSEGLVLGRGQRQAVGGGVGPP